MDLLPPSEVIGEDRLGGASHWVVIFPFGKRLEGSGTMFDVARLKRLSCTCYVIVMQPMWFGTALFVMRFWVVFSTVDSQAGCGRIWIFLSSYIRLESIGARFFQWLAGCCGKPAMISSFTIPMQPPSVDQVKVNVDGSLSKRRNSACIGGAVRGCCGEWLDGTFHGVEVKSDNSLLIDLLRSGPAVDSSFAELQLAHALCERS
ncbi:hypothetical protein GOBAR_DD24002 [Gossypium barbadense]|nr:hypothetical protein GOBAR_DD24002 [Gossypium barbadense]